MGRRPDRFALLTSDFSFSEDGATAFFRIPLKGQLYRVLISAEDVPLVAGTKWYLMAGADRRTFYVHSGTSRALLHRLIGGGPVDHRDGDGLNNRRSNLRPCNASQNGSNRRKSATGRTSALLGVYRRGDKFLASVRHAGKRYFCGVFLTEEAAGRAYDAKALELHGEFARLNFP